MPKLGDSRCLETRCKFRLFKLELVQGAVDRSGLARRGEHIP